MFIDKDFFGLSDEVFVKRVVKFGLFEKKEIGKFVFKLEKKVEEVDLYVIY